MIMKVKKENYDITYSCFDNLRFSKGLDDQPERHWTALQSDSKWPTGEGLGSRVICKLIELFIDWLTDWVNDKQLTGSLVD